MIEIKYTIRVKTEIKVKVKIIIEKIKRQIMTFSKKQNAAAASQSDAQ